ncbi:MAG: Uma2 family endonuclease [Fimbriiglobus sp.]
MATAAQRQIEYPESDGKPMAETDLHRRLMIDAIARLEARFSGDSDVYVSGNLFVYYDLGKPSKALAPDCFVVFGVPNADRRVFRTWDEGKFPDFVLEVTSRKTRREDTVHKRKIYETIWKVAEHFVFDPREEYLKPSFQGFRRTSSGYAAIPAVRDQLHSEVLGLKLERAGVRLLFRDPVTGHEVLTVAGERARQAEADRELADAKTADAEAEVARLKAELAALRKRKPTA